MDSKKLRILGIDYGHKRIGLALSDPTGTIASPMEAIKRDQRIIEKISTLIEANEVEKIVLGLPLRMDGQEASEALNVKIFGENLKETLKIEIDYMDERFSTKAADRTLIGANVRREKRKGVVDSMAASIILQSYLDREKNK